MIAVGVDAPFLTNDDGGWACATTYVARGATPDSQVLADTTFTCTGSGGYEGLTAVMASVMAEDYTETFQGLILEGTLPAVPQAPAAP